MNVFSLFAQLVLDTGDFENDLNRVRQTSSSFGSRLKDSFNLASTAGKAAMGIFSVAAIEAGKTFDSSMSQVAATMGLTVSELTTQIGTAQTAFGNFEGTLREFAQFMGANTAFSALEAADALNYMALAGYDAQTSMDMLPNVLNLAAAGSIDLAYASDMVTDASSALGLSIKETSELVDKMATASSKSNTSVAQLGEAILTVGGTAKNLAGGTTELASALGILADNGIKGAEGGTALRNIILSLAAPTDKVKKILEQFGGAEALVYDEAGNMRSLNDIFTDLNNIMSNMQASGRTELIASIFNTTDLKSVEALLANTGERFEELSGYIDNAKGSAEAIG